MKDPAELAEALSPHELDELLLDAERRGDLAEAEMYRQAVMARHQRAMYALRLRLDRYLDAARREYAWSTWRDDGLVGWRLRVGLGEAGHDVDTPGLSYWIGQDEDDEVVLMVDRLDAPEPTDFARRTARTYPAGDLAYKRAEHLIIAQITVGRTRS